MTPIQSLFLKTCPHCGTLIDIRRLKIIPCSTPLRWNQFTPAPQTACPQCDGLVKSSGLGPIWLIAIFALLAASLLGSAYSPAFAAFIRSFNGRLALLAVAACLSLFAVKNARLLPSSKPR